MSHLPRVPLAVLALVALGAAACNETPSPTAAEEALGEPLALATAAPEQSGPIVFRFEQDDQCFTTPFTDSRNGMGSFQCFIDVVSLCEGDPQFFTQATQVVYPALPEDVVVRLERADEMYVAIGKESFVSHRGSCADFLGNLVADGAARRMETDNDVNATGTRANAWGWMLHGVLDLAEGGQARYQEILRAGGPNPVYRIDLTPIE